MMQQQRHGEMHEMSCLIKPVSWSELPVRSAIRQKISVRH